MSPLSPVQSAGSLSLRGVTFHISEDAIPEGSSFNHLILRVEPAVDIGSDIDRITVNDVYAKEISVGTAANGKATIQIYRHNCYKGYPSLLVKTRAMHFSNLLSSLPLQLLYV